MDNKLETALGEIIKTTFETIDEIYKNRECEKNSFEGSRLIFPKYSNLNKTNQNQSSNVVLLIKLCGSEILISL